MPSLFSSRFYKRIERGIVPVLLLAGWEAFSRSGILPAALLPAPSQVVLAWADWIFSTDGNTQTYSGHWLFDIAASSGRVFAGFAIATVLGVAIGMAIGWSRSIESLVEPTLQTLRPVPPVSWIPLAIIWFGIANKPAIFLVFMGSFFPVLLSTIHGVKTCDRNLLRAGAMTGGTSSMLLRHIVFPAALPSIFSGLRIAIGSAWMLTVTAEMVAVKSGLGYVLWDSYYFLRYDLVLAAMISIGLLGYLSDLGLKAIMVRVLHWQSATTVQGRAG
jgi:NitT/TauT family transport system permease protein